MKKIVNLTPHAASVEQIAAGVIDLSENDRASLAQALAFDALPDEYILKERAKTIAMIAAGHSAGARYAMIGGAPYFMAPLEAALKQVGVWPVYAFSIRDSQHAGFVGLEPE